MRMMRCDREGHETGIALLEIMGALAITGGILLGAMRFSSAAADSSTIATRQLHELTKRGEELAELRATLSRCLVRVLPVNGTSVQYSVPLPVGVNGSFVDALGTRLFGAMDGGVPVQDGAYAIVFVPEEHRSEAQAGRDLNFDGDTADAFVIGHLRLTHDDGRPIRDLDLETFVNANDPAGDVDGDGIDDPIFSIDGLYLSVRTAYPNDTGWMVNLTKRFLVTATDV